MKKVVKNINVEKKSKPSYNMTKECQIIRTENVETQQVNESAQVGGSYSTETPPQNHYRKQK